MDINRLEEASKLLDKIRDYEYYIRHWREQEKKDIRDSVFISDDIFIEFKYNIIADMEYKKRQLEIEFENL